MSRTMLSRKVTGFLCLAIVAAYLYVGLYPFNFVARNRAARLPGGEAIAFRAPSVAYSETPRDFRNESGEITVELDLEPARVPREAIIFSLYDGRFPENMQISQAGNGVIVRVRWQEARVKTGLRPRARCLLRIRSNARGTTVQFAGEAPRFFPKLAMGPQLMRGRVVLGSSVRGRRSWEGTVFNVSISGSRVPLSLPPLFQPVHRSGPLFPWNRLDLEDIAINILGFVPFGFFYDRYRRSLARVLAAAAAISFTIELLQVFLPSRSPSFMDLICNVLGALIGLALARAFLRIAASQQRC